MDGVGRMTTADFSALGHEYEVMEKIHESAPVLRLEGSVQSSSEGQNVWFLVRIA